MWLVLVCLCICCVYNGFSSFTFSQPWEDQTYLKIYALSPNIWIFFPLLLILKINTPFHDLDLECDPRPWIKSLVPACDSIRG